MTDTKNRNDISGFGNDAIAGTNKHARLPLGSIAWFTAFAAVALGGFAYVNRPVETNIPWSSDFAAAKVAARERGTAMLVQFTTHGCVYCIKMDREVFTRDDVAAAVAQFEPVKLYWSDAQELGMRYGVEVFPTFIVIDPDEKPLIGSKGFMPPEDFKRFLKRASEMVSAKS